MALAPKGIDVRNTASKLVFRVLILASDGTIVTSGTANLYLYELQDDGTLKSYDFNDNTFKTTALTTETASMTHRQGNNGTTNTGVWTYALSTLSGFTEGGVYLARVNHTGGGPNDQYREFQFGGAEGDLAVSVSGNLDVNVAEISDGSTEADRLQAALTTTNGININMEQALPSAPGTADTTGEALSQCAVVQKDQWDRIFSSFGSSGANTLIGHLRAIMSKAASIPSGVGTYDPAYDSLEKHGENLVAIEGSGFATGTDSLHAIRAYLASLIAPAVVGSSALSGSGFLSDTVSLVRKMTDEPSLSPKYTDGDLVELVQEAFDELTMELNTNTDHPILSRINISIVDGQQDYPLPANCAEVWRLAKMSTETGTPLWEVWPGNNWDFSGIGFTIEGNNIRLLRDWGGSETLEVLYVPSSESYIHKGTASAATATTITLAETPTDGTLDTRANAYSGYVVRILSDTAGRLQERTVTAYNNVTRVATVSPAWDTTPSGTIVYEVVPLHTRLIKHIVAQKAAITILSSEGTRAKVATLERNLLTKMRALRLYIAKLQSRFTKHMEGDVVDNMNRLSPWGEVY